MTPTEAASYEASKAAQEASTAIANALFIDNATILIEQATERGELQIFLSHIRNVSFKDVSLYFRNLGYIVGISECPFWQFGYYGQSWFGWREHFRCRGICACESPCKLMITWKKYNGNQFGPCPWPG